MQLLPAKAAGADAIFEITDISGKLVGKYTLPASSNSLRITNDKVENGIYLYRVICNETTLKTGKIVIMK